MNAATASTRTDLLARSGLPSTPEMLERLVVMTNLSLGAVRKAVFTGRVGERNGTPVKVYIAVNWALDRLANRYFAKYRQRCTCGCGRRI